MVVNRSAPKATVVPILVYPDVAKAIDWLRDTFGFKERVRVEGREGIVYHRWTFSESIADAPFEAWGATPASQDVVG